MSSTAITVGLLSPAEMHWQRSANDSARCSGNNTNTITKTTGRHPVTTLKANYEIHRKRTAAIQKQIIDTNMQEAWSIGCQIAFLEKDCDEKRDEMEKLRTEIESIDEKIKGLDPQLAHGDERKRARTRSSFSTTKGTDHRAHLRHHPPNRHTSERSREIEGRPGFADIVMANMQIIAERTTEVENRLAVADFAPDWNINSSRSLSRSPSSPNNLS